MGRSTFDLTQIDFSLPDSKRNLLTSENVESVDSSACLGRPRDLLLGKTCPSELDGRLAWRSEPGPGSIHWISIRLKKPIEMDHLVLVTLPKRSQDGNRHGVRDCDIELTDEKGRKRRLSVRGNEEMLISIPFQLRRVKAIHITFGGANIPPGDQVCNSRRLPLYSLMGILGYRGQRIKPVEKRISLKIDNGISGTVCIFEGRELGGPIPGIDSGKIADFFLSRGYGVNFISADQLSAIPRNQIPFHLFIHLAGKRFPANSWLYRALRGKCHLLSVGSLPFSDPWVKVGGAWRRLGFDLGLTAAAPDWIQDHASKSPEQLRIDTTRHRTVQEAKSISEIAQGGKLELDGCFSGHAVTADLGEMLSIEQDRELARRGLWRRANVEARLRISRRPLMYGIWGHDYNPIFQTPCARLVPLLQACDSAGFYQGIIAGAVVNFAGRYEGSRWGVVEIDDVSRLRSGQNHSLHAWLSELGHRLVADPWLSFLRTGRYGLSPKDRCDITVHLNGGGTVPVGLELIVKSRDNVLSKRVIKKPPRLRPLNLSLQIPKDVPSGLITVQARIKDRDRVIDEIETGVLVRRKDDPKRFGPKLRYRNTIFRIDDKPAMLFGARTDGFHQWGQPEQEPLSWDKTLRQMRTMNLRVFSPVHLTFYETNGKLSETTWDIIETQAHLCRLHDIVFAPCLFFPGATDSIRDRKGSVRLAKEFARRLRHAEGVFLYLYDDGLPQDIQAFNAWIGELRKAIRKERPGTLITAEFVQHPAYHALIKATGKHLDFLAVSHHAMSQDVLPNLLVDSTIAGKATTNAEFGVYDPANSPSAGFKYRLNVRLGIAQYQSLIVNWMLRDPGHAQFPWGCLYAHDGFPKSTGLAFQAEALLVAGCRPIPPEEPPVAVLIPLNRMRFNQMDTAELSGGDFLLEEKLRMMVRAGIPFRIVNEGELDLLGPRAKFVVIPRLTDPDETLQRKLRMLAKRKVRILWQEDGFRPSPGILRGLVAEKVAVAIEPGSPAQFVGSIFRHIYGKEWVADLNRPYVLSRKFQEMTYTLIADLPKSEFSRNTGRIALEGREFEYEFDEDHLGVLLHTKGRVVGATGFRKLSTGSSPILEGPGTFYYLSLPGKSLLIIPHTPGRYRFHGHFGSRTVLARPGGFEDGALKLGEARAVKGGKIGEMDFEAGDVGRFWFVGSKQQITRGVGSLMERLR